jgi:putative transposase
VSRQFVAASSNQLRVLCERRLEDLNLVVLMIDGIHFGGQVLVVALGIAEGGEKHILAVWQGATENTAVVKGLLEDLVDRGLDLQRRYLVVMDGSKALRAGVERVFGEQVEVKWSCRFAEVTAVAILPSLIALSGCEDPFLLDYPVESKGSKSIAGKGL